jgi:hypothetical protein
MSVPSAKGQEPMRGLCTNVKRTSLHEQATTAAFDSSEALSLMNPKPPLRCMIKKQQTDPVKKRLFLTSRIETVYVCIPE